LRFFGSKLNYDKLTTTTVQMLLFKLDSLSLVQGQIGKKMLKET